MNPAYFTPDNIHEKARELQRRLQGAVGKRGRPFIPGEAALFVIDMQRYFVSPVVTRFCPVPPR